MKYFLAFIICFILNNCSSEPDTPQVIEQPVFILDCSSDSAFEASLEAINANLDSSIHEELAEAILYLALEDVNNLFVGLEMMGNRSAIRSNLEGIASGLTGREIIELSDSKQRAKDISSLKSNIRGDKRKIGELESTIISLKAQLDSMKLNENGLKLFTISNSKFFWETEGYLPQPKIEFTFTNGSKISLSRIYCDGVLHTPSRTIPWVKDSFNFEISGGIEPDETLTWIISPNSYGDWGNAPKNRDDMELSLIVFKVDGPSGKTLYSISDSERYLKRIIRNQERLIKQKDSLERNVNRLSSLERKLDRLSSLSDSPEDRYKRFTQKSNLENAARVKALQRKEAEQTGAKAAAKKEVVVVEEVVVDTFFTLGSNKEWVSTVQGQPIQIRGPEWRYGFSTVQFNRDLVISWNSSELNPLKVGMILDPDRYYSERYFGVGSRQDEVASIQGAPDIIAPNKWTWGDAWVEFDEDTVVTWQNDASLRLAIRD